MVIKAAIVIVISLIVLAEILKKRRRNKAIAEHNAKNREACKMAADFFPKDINDSIKHIAGAIEGKYPNVKVKANLSRSFLPLLIERKTLEDIIINLIKNAAEATEKEGEIEITTKNKRDFWVLEITDNGKGIKPEDIKKIFKAGYSSKKQKSSGLGLYSVKKEVEKTGGKVEVFSQAKKTTFTILIPQQKIQAVVVEDEPVLRQILVTILKQNGMLVTAFNRFERIDYKNVDVLYLDIMLWGESSLKEYHDLRKTNPNLIIIFISGSSEHQGLDDILRQDKKTALLLKPYHESEPVDKVTNLLAKN